MLPFKTRLRPLLLVMAALFAVSVQAEAKPSAVKTTGKNYVSVAKKSYFSSEQERSAEYQRREQIVDHANNLFTLLGAEMALQKGEAGTALATYMVMVERTKDPEVAERAIDMAVSLHAYDQAEAIYQKWRTIEPVPGPAQKRMAWVRGLVRGENDQTITQLQDILPSANVEQTKRIFLLLAQMSMQQPDLVQKGVKSVHKAAAGYPDMPEAAIADVLFSAAANKDKDAVAALQRLASLDSNILPPTELALRLVAQRNPNVLNRFFAEIDTRNLSPVWQEMEVSSLIASGKADRAYDRLQTLLAANPNADLYLQAALLAVVRQEPLSVVNTYLEKGYAIGTQEQKSRAAVIGSMRNADNKDYARAQVWTDRISAPEYAYDKAVLRASLYAEQSKWHEVLLETEKAKKLPEQQGRFFNANDLQRVRMPALSYAASPQQALAEINDLLKKAEKQQGNESEVAEILYQRAMIYADRLNQPDKAITDLRRYMKLNPGSAMGMNALGYTMLLSDKYDKDEAFRLVQTAYQMEPESAAVNDSMGWAYYLKGDVQSALPYLKYAFEQYPDAEVAAHLGEVLWKQGDQEQARAVFAKGLAGSGDVGQVKRVMQRLGVVLTSKATVAHKKHR